MAASEVGAIVTLQQILQDRTFQRRQLGRPTMARTRNIDMDVVRDAAFLDDQYTISQRDGFGHIVRHQDRGETLIVPDPFQQPLHRNTRQRIERTEASDRATRYGILSKKLDVSKAVDRSFTAAANLN
jgi:hypothetical protein